uniref:Phage protein n=1 Tax=Ascaris lumbricoides TaxID=6252 RepID=A0A0M3HWJ8_ASCLU
MTKLINGPSFEKFTHTFEERVQWRGGRTSFYVSEDVNHSAQKAVRVCSVVSEKGHSNRVKIETIDFL